MFIFSCDALREHEALSLLLVKNKVVVVNLAIPSCQPEDTIFLIRLSWC